MKRRMKTIKELNNLIQSITTATVELSGLASKESNKEIKNFLLTIVKAYSDINIKVSLYMLTNTVNYYKKDLIDINFENITKNLEQEFKDKKPKGKKDGTQDKS